jgi:hypothetical protein
VSGILRELSACLCKWNHQLDHVASFLVRASGCRFQRGLICRSTEVADEIDYGCLFVSLLFSGLLQALAVLLSGALSDCTYIQSGKTVVDVSVSHPSGVALRAASDATDGSAAARRNAEKSCAYNRLARNGHPRVAFSVETYGRLGKAAIGILGRLGAEAVAADNVSKSGSVAAALWQLR